MTSTGIDALLARMEYDPQKWFKITSTQYAYIELSINISGGMNEGDAFYLTGIDVEGSVHPTFDEATAKAKEILEAR